MTTSILRTADAWWVQTASGAARIDTDATTTRELLADRAAIDAAAKSTDTVPVESLALLSPITTPCRVVAQATNFASHVKDVGRDPAKTPLTFFRKASGSVTGPFGDIVKPSHVKLLDYELEIGLVFGRELPVGTEVTAANLADFVVGLVVTNDISARDVQLTKQQFFESKSYPTFTPVGPALVLVDAEELKRFGELRLRLSVNGEVRQDMVIEGDILYPPVQALQALSKFQKVDAGDILLTGTPVGTALTLHGVTPKGDMDLGAFLTAQFEKNPAYLQDGDVVEATIATDDGAIDLGVQRNVVVYNCPRRTTACRNSFLLWSSVPARPASPPRHCWANTASKPWCWTATRPSTRCRGRCMLTTRCFASWPGWVSARSSPPIAGQGTVFG